MGLASVLDGLEYALLTEALLDQLLWAKKSYLLLGHTSLLLLEIVRDVDAILTILDAPRLL